MKKKLVNRKVVSSIGVGILAAMTTCTSVYAATDVIPQEGENKQEDSSEAEVPIREQTEEEKQNYVQSMQNNFQFERGADLELANIMRKCDCAEAGERRGPVKLSVRGSEGTELLPSRGGCHPALQWYEEADLELRHSHFC